MLSAALPCLLAALASGPFVHIASNDALIRIPAKRYHFNACNLTDGESAVVYDNGDGMLRVTRYDVYLQEKATIEVARRNTLNYFGIDGLHAGGYVVVFIDDVTHQTRMVLYNESDVNTTDTLVDNPPNVHYHPSVSVAPDDGSIFVVWGQGGVTGWEYSSEGEKIHEFPTVGSGVDEGPTIYGDEMWNVTWVAALTSNDIAAGSKLAGDNTQLHLSHPLLDHSLFHVVWTFKDYPLLNHSDCDYNLGRYSTIDVQQSHVCPDHNELDVIRFFPPFSHHQTWDRVWSYVDDHHNFTSWALQPLSHEQCVIVRLNSSVVTVQVLDLSSTGIPLGLPPNDVFDLVHEIEGTPRNVEVVTLFPGRVAIFYRLANGSEEHVAAIVVGTPVVATAAPSSDAPETPAPPTNAPATIAPPTTAPATASPPTNAPQTVAPPTIAPATSSPPTNAPATGSPPTTAPVTAAPPTIAPATGSPPTNAPATASPLPPFDIGRVAQGDMFGLGCGSEGGSIARGAGEGRWLLACRAGGASDPRIEARAYQWEAALGGAADYTLRSNESDSAYGPHAAHLGESLFAVSVTEAALLDGHRTSHYEATARTFTNASGVLAASGGPGPGLPASDEHLMVHHAKLAYFGAAGGALLAVFFRSNESWAPDRGDTLWAAFVAADGSAEAVPMRVDHHDWEAGRIHKFAMAESGPCALIVWCDSLSSGTFARVVNSTTRGFAGSAFRVDEPAADGVDGGAAAATLGNGSFVVAWLRYDSYSEVAIHARIVGADGSLGDEFVVAEEAAEPSVVALDNGGFAIAYSHEAPEPATTQTTVRFYDPTASHVGSKSVTGAAGVSSVVLSSVAQIAANTLVLGGTAYRGAGSDLTLPSLHGVLFTWL
ncbi:hypothetical protein DIPPA_01823 [Diplonema papillatum]|nr:hypothetical protein DIPPA_01823 [Diplonema papillatum]